MATNITALMGYIEDVLAWAVENPVTGVMLASTIVGTAAATLARLIRRY